MWSEQENEWPAVALYIAIGFAVLESAYSDVTTCAISLLHQ
jgi:hypothetical protein